MHGVVPLQIEQRRYEWRRPRNPNRIACAAPDAASIRGLGGASHEKYRAGRHRPAKRYHEKLPGHHRSRQRGHRLARLRGLWVVYIQHNSLSCDRPVPLALFRERRHAVGQRVGKGRRAC